MTTREEGRNVHTAACGSPDCPCYQEGGKVGQERLARELQRLAENIRAQALSYLPESRG